MQITVETDRTVLTFYKFLKKRASIPFKLQKPASSSPQKTESSDHSDTDRHASSICGDLKDEL